LRLPYYRPRGLEGEGKVIALPILDIDTREGRWSATRPGRFTPGKVPVPIVQEAGWAPGPDWACAKNLVPPGFDPWTLQAVVSCYTD
jgi:hypothetical protein